MELLKQLYAIHAPSGKEKRIRTFIEGYVFKNIQTAHVAVDKTGNLFITKGSAETYPCIVAHLDQVQHYHSKDFRAIETRDVIFGYSPSKRRQEGLGADDKNGIWIALKCLRKYEAIKIALFVGEEVGCIGSNAADLAFFEDCRFVIQPDRRGFNDLITQISWENLCSGEFLSDIQPERFGYKPTEGLMTDIEILRENGLSLSCINLSCGYYEPHTDHEFTVKDDLWNCLNFVQHIIENCTKTYPHQSEPHANRYDYSGFDFPEDMIFDILMAQPDYTAEEAWEVYSTNFPGFSKEEFEDLYEECRIAYGVDAS
ncbi:MAG: hypothetical protein RR559_09815, partial [Bacteroides sp.]